MDNEQLPDEGPPERDDSREFSEADDGEPEVLGSEDEGENLEDNAARHADHCGVGGTEPAGA